MKADVSSVSPSSERFREGLTLESSAFNLFTLANLPYQPSWLIQNFLSQGHTSTLHLSTDMRCVNSCKLLCPLVDSRSPFSSLISVIPFCQISFPHINSLRWPLVDSHTVLSTLTPFCQLLWPLVDAHALSKQPQRSKADRTASILIGLPNISIRQNL